MVGFDLTRSPHPFAVEILIPFLSGGVFLTGFAYFHPELTEPFFAQGHMDSVLRAAVLLILTYTTALILQGVVLIPFISLTFGFAHLVTRIRVKAAESRSKTVIRASAWPSFRRAATVVLGEAMVPQSPNMSADSLVERVPEAPKTSLSDFDRQWREIFTELFVGSKAKKTTVSTISFSRS